LLTEVAVEESEDAPERISSCCCKFRGFCCRHRIRCTSESSQNHKQDKDSSEVFEASCYYEIRLNLMEMEQERCEENLILKNKKIEMKQERPKEKMILKNKEIDMEQERHKEHTILNNKEIQIKQEHHKEDRILKKVEIEIKIKRHKVDMILNNKEIEASTILAKEQDKKLN